MNTLTPLYPRTIVPQLSLPLVGGDHFELARETPQNFSMIVFYRGLHCPICSVYLGDLNRKIDAFGERGVSVVAISSDAQARATQAKQDWQLDRLRIAYNLSLDQGRDWGLYISAGIGKTSSGIEEPKLFTEPGLFLVRPNGELYFASVQTMPFARPAFGDLLKALDFVITKNYPGRGEIVEY